MGTDSYVVLRVRDRAILRQALDAQSLPPLLRPLGDDAVAMFTGLRFHDTDLAYGIRCWLHDLFAERLPELHDDARGVFVYPDICAPRAKTYDGVLAELAEVGRFVVPTPPTKAEEEERIQSFEAFSRGMDAVRAAQASGDAAALEAALAAAPADVRESWNASARFANGPLLEQMQGDIGKRMQEIMDRLLASGELEKMITAAESAPEGCGSVSVLLPRAVVEAIARDDKLEGSGLYEMADGSAVYVSQWLGEEGNVSRDLAEALDRVGFDRRSLDKLPFFKESLAKEIVAAGSFEAARERLGDRATPMLLRTFDELFADEEAETAAWLAER